MSLSSVLILSQFDTLLHYFISDMFQVDHSHECIILPIEFLHPPEDANMS
jgi:hypothetical protein